MQLPLNIKQTEINKFVAKIISAMVNDPRFVEAIQAKIGTAVDTEDMEKRIAVLQGQLKQTFGTKSRLERQMDTLDINDANVAALGEMWQSWMFRTICFGHWNCKSSKESIRFG